MKIHFLKRGNTSQIFILMMSYEASCEACAGCPFYIDKSCSLFEKAEKSFSKSNKLPKSLQPEAIFFMANCPQAQADLKKNRQAYHVMKSRELKKERKLASLTNEEREQLLKRKADSHYAKRPEYQERRKLAQQERYKNDPVFRAKQIERAKLRQARLRENKEI